jgi:hypothetical protein
VRQSAGKQECPRTATSAQKDTATDIKELANTQPELSDRVSCNEFFKPWEAHHGVDEYVQNLCKKKVLPAWEILYCGGSQIITEQSLHTVSHQFGINLHVESFDW